LARHRLNTGVALGAAVAAALCLSACGRKGNLEMPPGPGTQPPVAAAPMSPGGLLPSSHAALTPEQEQAQAQKNGFDAHGNPVAAPGQKKTFILDPILQ
jgi:predicted small lipoprotein YifL